MIPWVQGAKFKKTLFFRDFLKNIKKTFKKAAQEMEKQRSTGLR